MTFKRTVKRIISFMPKWLFNVIISLTKNKKQQNTELPIESIYPDNGHSSLKPKRVYSNKSYDLKIIVPCYNVEKYVIECIDSIVNQKTKYKVAVVLVNDGSTDQTLTILKKYESENVVIIDKPNGGQSSARNRALECVESKYVMFVDSDDCFLSDGFLDFALDCVYKVKKESSKKIIIEFKHSNLKCEPHYKSGLKIVNYKELSGFAWGKIFSTDLFSNANFPEGYWFEDTVLPTIIFPLADACFLNKSIVYFYRPTINSITDRSKTQVKVLDTFYVTRQLLCDRDELNLPKDNTYYYRFYMQVICNCIRLSILPKEVQIKIFFETIDLFNKYSIKPIRQFRSLYKSFCYKNFERYLKFCILYSKMYLNL